MLRANPSSPNNSLNFPESVAIKYRDPSHALRNRLEAYATLPSLHSLRGRRIKLLKYSLSILSPFQPLAQPVPVLSYYLLWELPLADPAYCGLLS
jgi:hypothetical protein